MVMVVVRSYRGYDQSFSQWPFVLTAEQIDNSIVFDSAIPPKIEPLSFLLSYLWPPSVINESPIDSNGVQTK